MQETKLQRTPLYPIHKQLGAIIRPFAGYEMPIHYGSIVAEHKAVREQVGLFDVSHMCTFIIEGESALPLLQYVCSNDLSQVAVGCAQYTCLPNEKGGIVEDALVYRLGRERYMLVGNAANQTKDWQWLKKHNSNYEATLQNSSNGQSILALQGPQATAVLEQLTDVSLAGIPYYGFSRGIVAEIVNVLVSHTGYTGAGGYELYVGNEDVQKLWAAIMKIGKTHQLQPVGLAARDTLRLEMGYCLYGQDLDETTSPIEAGLGWITKFTKPFVGSEYLQRQKIQGAPKQLINMVLEERGGIPRAGAAILNEEELKIGEVTSGNLSPSLQKGIAMGYVSTAYAKLHNKLYIQIRNRSFTAEIVKFPSWKVR